MYLTKFSSPSRKSPINRRLACSFILGEALIQLISFDNIMASNFNRSMLILFLIVLFVQVRFFEARQLASSKEKLNALLPKVLGTPRRVNDRAIAKDGRLITGPHSARALFDRNLEESHPSPGGGH
ncbi:hypothetical protein SLE2022_316570 [Rubroshorea leprosula]